jgi:hypothetical protein
LPGGSCSNASNVNALATPDALSNVWYTWSKCHGLYENVCIPLANNYTIVANRSLLAFFRYITVLASKFGSTLVTMNTLFRRIFSAENLNIFQQCLRANIKRVTGGQQF